MCFKKLYGFLRRKKKMASVRDLMYRVKEGTNALIGKGFTSSDAKAHIEACSNLAKISLLMSDEAAKKKGIVPPLTELKNAKANMLYRDGQKGAGCRGNEKQTGENAPFYEVLGLPEPIEPYDASKHKCPFECYMNGRGHYHHYGVNGSGDFKLSFMIKGKLYGLFIIRKKEKKHAMPGGMKEISEEFFTDAALRELFEEAFSKASESEIETLCGLFLKGSPKLIYEGVMDDKRNTNQAYGYSCVMNIHFDGEDALEIMETIRSMLSHCENETIGAEIVEITDEFIQHQLWSTHRSSIEAVKNYYLPN